MAPSSTLSLLSLYQPDWAADPYALYHAMREDGPVQWDDWMRSWIVLGHAEIAQLSKDDRLSGARIGDFHAQLPESVRSDMKPLAGALSDMMLFNEPPEHSRLRRIIKPGLTPRFIREMRPLIAERAEELVDAVLDQGHMDVIGDFSEPLSRNVIAHLAGVPGHATPLLENWQGLLHEFFTQSCAEVPRVKSLRAAFDEQAAKRRAGTADDLFSQVIAGALERETYTDDEVFANFLLLIDAGQATTTHLIGNAVLALLRHPDQLARLRADPGLCQVAVHELMRYDSSVQFTTRVALEGMEVGDQHVEQGQSVTLVLGAGNRDPRRYDDPDRLDVTRKATDHLSFGHGIHYCLGASLALAEIEIALRVLLERTTELRLRTDDLDWLDSINFRFAKELPVEFDT
ncbi:cytochrome P450 [Saccharopolyspora sp. NPDC047091]|uniref:cytochrome P450 n=1 Tax=Saccharopolyspora sp. NPDC047091 TaxID=3155924 RepID=UPI0033D0E8C8